MSHPGHPFIVVDYKAPDTRRFREKWDKIIPTSSKDASKHKSPKQDRVPPDEV
jgi:hypothetical protein